MNKYTIEKAEFVKFETQYLSVHPSERHLRYGQAFYNHFNCHKMADQNLMNIIYNAANDRACYLIKEYFEMS